MGPPDAAARAPRPHHASEDAVTVEQHCEVCGSAVRLLVIRTPEGSPDLVRPFFPDGAWLGWSLTGEADRAVAITAFCSRSCVVEWFDLAHSSDR